MAMMLAVLKSKDIKHPPLECLFTVDEETGLTGAFALDRNLLKSKVLINLDSEDDGEIFVGCAGGVDTVAVLKYEQEPAPDNYFGFRVSVRGLLGGVERYDDEADVFMVEFPDGSWCIHFNIKGLKKWTKNI